MTGSQTRIARFRVVGSSLLVLSACADGASEQPRAAPSWQVSNEPALQISDPELFGVHDARRLPDGSVAVANGGSHELRIYDARGQLIRVGGGEGEGPGEMQSMGGMALVGDTVLLHDTRLGRLNEFTTDGAWLRGIPIPGGQSVGLVGAVDSVLVFRPQGGQRFDLTKPGISWHTDPHRAYTRDGEPLGEFGDPYGMHYSTRDGMPVIPHFARRTQSASGGGRFYAGDQERYEVRVYDAQGRQQHLIQLPIEPEPATEAEVERYTTSLLEAIRDSAIRERTAASADNTEALPTKPAYRRLLVDARGRLWVEDWRIVWAAVGDWRSRWEEGPANWRVFDSEGVLLASVEMPERFELMDAGEAYVLGVWRDAYGVEEVRLYGLTGGAARVP